MGYADGEGDWDGSSTARRAASFWRAILGLPAFVSARLRLTADKVSPDRLSIRLVVALLLISSVLSVFATGLQVYSSYTRQKNDALQLLDQIEQVMQRQLEHALWQFDFDQVDLILDGLMAHEDIAHLALMSPTGHSWTRGTPQDGGVMDKIQLEMATSDRGHVVVGQLHVHLSLSHVAARVKQQFWVTLISNIGKAYIAALVFLVVVHRMIIRHLRKIATHVSGAQPLDPAARLYLYRKSAQSGDALDQIVGAVNGYDVRVESYVKQLETEILMREAAQAKADRAAQARTQFLSNMSRDIRTPMNSILGLFQLIKDGDDVPTHSRQQAEIGHRAAHALSTQLANVLDLSRLDSLDVSPRPVVTDLRDLAQTWLAQARMQVARRETDVQVTLDCAGDLAKTYNIDGDRVGRIVECLVDNAVKFCETGQIALTLRPLVDDGAPETGHGGIEILVRDCAPAIRYEDRERIFERFTRVEEHLNCKANGAGLGLALARDMAALFGGTVRVEESDAAPFINVFRVTLPEVQAIS